MTAPETPPPKLWGREPDRYRNHWSGSWDVGVLGTYSIFCRIDRTWYHSLDYDTIHPSAQAAATALQTELDRRIDELVRYRTERLGDPSGITCTVTLDPEESVQFLALLQRQPEPKAALIDLLRQGLKETSNVRND